MTKNLFNNNLSWFVGQRYAGVRAETHLLSFLSRVAMLGLVLGTALLIVVLSVMNGFDRELRERILNIVPHISYYHEGRGDVDWNAVQQTIRSDKNVSEVVPFIEMEGLLKSADHTEPLVFYGVEKYPALQEYISEADMRAWQSVPEGLLVSASMAEKLNLKRTDQVVGILSVDNPGKHDALSSMALQRFQVVGIFDTKTELDKALVVAHLSALQTIAGMKGPEGIRVQVQDIFTASVVGWRLLQKLPDDFSLRTWQQTHGNLYEAVQMSRALVSLLMFVVIAVAVFNIVSTLVLVVIEKKQAIAILRVQGASRMQIIRIFIVQGTLIGVIGSCVGAAIGIGISLILPDAVAFMESAFHFKFLKTEVYPISFIPADLRLAQVAVVVILATLFSFIASLYPAWRATRIDPALVLRYE